MKRMVEICARCPRFRVHHQSTKEWQADVQFHDLTTARGFPHQKRMSRGLDMDRYICQGAGLPYLWVEEFFGQEVPENCAMVAEYAVSAQ